MSTDLGPAYSPDWHGRPPHMSPQDAWLWSLWLPRVAQPTDRIHFDVAVTRLPETTDPDTTEAMRAMWRRITAKRIDAVIIRPTTVWLCELRWDASESAIGRLLCYADLWALDPPTPHTPQLHLVTNRPGPQWQPTAARYGIITTVMSDAA